MYALCVAASKMRSKEPPCASSNATKVLLPSPPVAPSVCVNPSHHPGGNLKTEFLPATPTKIPGQGRLSFAELKHHYIRPQCTKVGTKLTIPELAIWVSTTARHEYPIKRNPEEKEHFSPERIELFREFENIHRHFVDEDPGVLRKMENSASERYVRSVLGVGTVQGQFDNVGRNMQLLPTPDTHTPLPRRRLDFAHSAKFQGKSPLSSVDKNAAKPKKKNIAWKNKPARFIKTLRLAKSVVQSEYSHLVPSRTTSSVKIRKTCWFTCDKRTCGARIDCLNDGKFTLKVDRKSVV